MAWIVVFCVLVMDTAMNQNSKRVCMSAFLFWICSQYFFCPWMFCMMYTLMMIFFLYGSGMDILILLLLSYNSITKSKNCLLFHEANIKPLHSRSGQRANSIAATHNTLNGLGWPFAANAINFGNKKQNEHNNNNSRDDEWEMEMKQEWKTNQNLLTDNLKANWNVRCSVKYSPLLTMSCSAQFPICLWIWFFFCSCSD